MKHAIKNGMLINEEDATVNVTCREVQQNFSIYEALRMVGNKVVHLDDHYARLAHSASQIGLKLNVSVENLNLWIKNLVEKDNLEDATIRILVYGGAVNTVFITWTPLLTYPAGYYEEGVAVTTYEGERFLPTCKTSNLLLSYLALEDAHNKCAFEALLVDRFSRVLEGTRSNFYAIKDNVLYTAPDELVLSGVTRISVLKAAEELGLTTVFYPVTRDSLLDYDEIFISSTSMAAMPISFVDGKKLSGGHEITLKIKDKVREWEVL
jgi:Branched-chain amino acid aminotransferase/4-amino-4-deoxychorismate lyase